MRESQRTTSGPKTSRGSLNSDKCRLDRISGLVVHGSAPCPKAMAARRMSKPERFTTESATTQVVFLGAISCVTRPLVFGGLVVTATSSLRISLPS